MNKTKELYKQRIINLIADEYVALDNHICATQGCMEQNVLDQKVATLKYLKNLIKTITSESEDAVEEIINEAKDRYYNEKEEENND